MRLNLPIHGRAAFAALLLLSACSQAADLPAADSASPPEYAALLKTYVSPSGVRYSAWKQSPADLDALKKVTDFYAGNQPPKDLSASLAWHLNAYNAWILHNILKEYPVKGPLAASKLFFHENRLTVAGEKMSFDRFEQKIIRPTFKEPRVHFALNCASASCPPLSGRPFQADTLDQQLDELTRAFVTSNPRAVKLSAGGVELSRIFEWYKDDFAAAGGSVSFINRFRSEPLPAKGKVKFMEYDWSLNETK